MPTLVPHYFNKYEFTEAELIAATAGISDLAAMWFHNFVATAMEEKAELILDPDKPLDFIQKEAYLKGQIDALLTILTARPSQQ